MNLNQFLVYLMGIGSVIVASWLLERFNWFQSQTSENRQYIFFGVASGLGVVAWAVATYVPVDVLTQFSPIFTIVGAAFANIFLGTKFHESDNVSKG